MHDLLFANHDRLTREALDLHALELGLDMTRFKIDLDTEAFGGTISRNVEEAQKLQLRGVPHTYLNGRHARGIRSVDELAAVIVQEQRKAKRLLEQGVARSALYETIVSNTKSMNGDGG